MAHFITIAVITIVGASLLLSCLQQYYTVIGITIVITVIITITVTTHPRLDLSFLPYSPIGLFQH